LSVFEQLHRRDDTCLERRSDGDALRSTSLADRDVTPAMRVTRATTSGQMLIQRNEFTLRRQKYDPYTTCRYPKQEN